MIEQLLKLGLSQKEAQVYVAVLELAEDTAQNIAKKADVNRATTYVILERLMSLGLVSSIESGKKTHFIAEDPSELENLLEEQMQQVESRKKYLSEVMGQLKAIHNRNATKPSVRYFEGADGLEALDRFGRDELKAGTQLLSVIPVDTVEKYFPARRKASVEERVKRKIPSRTIYTHKDGELPEYRNKDELRDGIYIPRSELPIEGTVQIYPGWGVKFFNFNPSNFFGVVIQSPDFADTMREVFELAWEGAQNRKTKR